jgi:hypothetical protein
VFSVDIWMSAANAGIAIRTRTASVVRMVPGIEGNSPCIAGPGYGPADLESFFNGAKLSVA